MTSKESSQVISIIGSIYTNYKPMSMDIAVEAWRAIFSDVSYKVVVGALYSYAKDNKEFPPTPGQINEIIHQAVGTDSVSESEAWNMVLLAIRNGTYGADAEYAKLPEDVQQAIGGSHYLHELALSEDVKWGVESSNFYRNLRTVRERKRNMENLPGSVKEQIEQLKENLNGGQIENKQEVARLEQKEQYDEITRLTLQAMEKEEREMPEDAKRFADMLREKLGMKRREDIEPEEEELDEMPYYDEDIFA